MSAWKTEDATIPNSGSFRPSTTRFVDHLSRPTLNASLDGVSGHFTGGVGENGGTTRPLTFRNWMPCWGLHQIRCMSALPVKTEYSENITAWYRFNKKRRRMGGLRCRGWKSNLPVSAHPDRRIVYIIDGRHRFAWMRHHGADSLRVAAPASEASERARSLLGRPFFLWGHDVQNS